MRFAFVIQGEHSEADNLDASIEEYLGSVVKALGNRGYVGELGCDFGRDGSDEVIFVAEDQTTVSIVPDAADDHPVVEALAGTADLPTQPPFDPAGFLVPELKVRLKYLKGRGLTVEEVDALITSELAGKARDTAIRALKQTRDALG